MSDVFTDTCNAIVERIKSFGIFGGMNVVADDQQDIVGETMKVAARNVANLILVTDAGGENKTPEKDVVKLNHVFNVTLWSPQVKAPTAVSANTLKQALLQALHNHRPKLPNGNEVHVNDRWVAMGCVKITPEDDLPLLVHRIPVQIPIYIPKLSTPTA